MPLNLLLAWWNLIYVVPFGLALAYLGLFVFTGITFGDADADADMDTDVDATVHVEAHVAEIGADADADMDANAEVDADADAGADAGLEHDAEGPSSGASLARSAAAADALRLHGADSFAGGAEGGSIFLSFLSLLGLGKIPLSLALMIFLFSWGVVGFSLNALLYSWLGMSVLVGIISVPITLIVSLALTGLLAALVGRIIPNDDGIRQRRADLVGKSGEAIFDIDGTFGMANVRGDAGDLFQIPCRSTDPAKKIAKGTRIVIFDYDREEGVFHVAPFDA